MIWFLITLLLPCCFTFQIQLLTLALVVIAFFHSFTLMNFHLIKFPKTTNNFYVALKLKAVKNKNGFNDVILALLKFIKI